MWIENLMKSIKYGHPNMKKNLYKEEPNILKIRNATSILKNSKLVGAITCLHNYLRYRRKVS